MVDFAALPFVPLISFPLSLLKLCVKSVLPLRLSLAVSEHPRDILAFQSRLAVCTLPCCKPQFSVVVTCFPWVYLLKRASQHYVRSF